MKNKKNINYKIFLYAFPWYSLICVYLTTPLIKLNNLIKQNPIMSNKFSSANVNVVCDMYKSPLLCFKELTNLSILKSFLISFLVITIILAVLIFVLFHMEKGDGQVGINYLKENGVQGTANWMENEECKKVLGVGTNEGLVFGTIKDRGRNKMLTLPSKSFFNRNVAVFGASGSMKSRSFVRPNVMQLTQLKCADGSIGQSMIITDPKGELFESMAIFLKKQEYEVKVLNLVNMAHSDRWNPIGEITDDISAQSFAETVMANTKAPGAKKDEFWDNAEMNLLKAVVLYVIREVPKEKRNLCEVYTILALKNSNEIDNMFESLDSDHPAKMPYNIYKQAGERVRSGVIIGLGSKLQIFQNKLVQDLTSTSDIDLTLPKRKKCAYFCITSDMESTFDFIAGLFFSFLFIKLTRYADYHSTKRQKDVYFILDEFPNIGAIPDFTKKISTMRSRGISSCVIFQNIAQLQNRYPDNAWSEIIGNCDSRLFLGATDMVTAQFVSDLLGVTTVNDKIVSKSAGFEGLFEFGKVTKRAVKRNLMNPDEVLQLPNTNAILILRGQKPTLLNKMDYTEHKLSKEMEDIQISNYKPNWAKNYYIKEEEDKENITDFNTEAEEQKQIKSSLLSAIKTINGKETPNVLGEKVGNIFNGVYKTGIEKLKDKNKASSENEEKPIREKSFYIGDTNQSNIENTIKDTHKEKKDLNTDDFW